MDIFKALADSHRRNIIEALYQQQDQSIKQLAHGASISRQGITKHLNILIKAKIVSARYQGKERLHTLNPAAVETLLNWVAGLSQHWDKRLENLSQYLEQKP